MVVGILGAVAQTDIRRMLSFTLVSHIGYMVFGIALGDGGRAGRRDLLRGPPHRHPDDAVPRRRAGRAAGRHDVAGPARRTGQAVAAAGVLFFVPAMNLAGIPPFSGFIGKLGLLRPASPTAARWRCTLVAGGVLTSLLTLLAIARVWNRAFWRPPTQEPAPTPPPRRPATPAGPGRGASRRRWARRRPDGEPSARQAAWQAAWRRHEQVATAGAPDRRPPATSGRALRRCRG